MISLKKIKLKIILFISLNLLVILGGFSQQNNSNNSKINPLSLISKVLKYGRENQNTFLGNCEVGSVTGTSYFNFNAFSLQYPNLIIRYTALGRSVTETGILKNLTYKADGTFNTKKIVADWINSDKKAGSGTFVLGLLSENDLNKIWISVDGDRWRYFTVVTVNPDQYQEIINLLTISGKPRNAIAERDSILQVYNNRLLDNQIYTKVDTEAEFPSGKNGWDRYLIREVERSIDKIQDDNKSGTVTCEFVIDKEGSISEVRALACNEIDLNSCLGPETVFAQVLIHAIKRGPKWRPAILDGVRVNSSQRKSLSFKINQK